MSRPAIPPRLIDPSDQGPVCQVCGQRAYFYRQAPPETLQGVDGSDYVISPPRVETWCRHHVPGGAL